MKHATVASSMTKPYLHHPCKVTQVEQVVAFCRSWQQLAGSGRVHCKRGCNQVLAEAFDGVRKRLRRQVPVEDRPKDGPQGVIRHLHNHNSEHKHLKSHTYGIACNTGRMQLCMS